MWLRNIVIKELHNSNQARFCFLCLPLCPLQSRQTVLITKDRDVLQRHQPSSQLYALFIKMKPYLSIKVAVMRWNNPSDVFRCAIFITLYISRGGGRVIRKSFGWDTDSIRELQNPSLSLSVVFYSLLLLIPHMLIFSHPLSVLKHCLSPLFNGQKYLSFFWFLLSFTTLSLIAFSILSCFSLFPSLSV